MNSALLLQHVEVELRRDVGPIRPLAEFYVALTYGFNYFVTNLVHS